MSDSIEILDRNICNQIYNSSEYLGDKLDYLIDIYKENINNEESGKIRIAEFKIMAYKGDERFEYKPRPEEVLESILVINNDRIRQRLEGEFYTILREEKIDKKRIELKNKELKKDKNEKNILEKKEINNNKEENIIDNRNKKEKIEDEEDFNEEESMIYLENTVANINRLPNPLHDMNKRFSQSSGVRKRLIKERLANKGMINYELITDILELFDQLNYLSRGERLNKLIDIGKDIGKPGIYRFQRKIELPIYSKGEKKIIKEGEIYLVPEEDLEKFINQDKLILNNSFSEKVDMRTGRNIYNIYMKEAIEVLYIVCDGLDNIYYIAYRYR